MKTIDDINFSGKKALVRVDFNVPLDKNHKITDDNRMQAAVPTLKKILKDGGSAILMSHLGRPKEGPEEKFSLKHLVDHLSTLLDGTQVHFANDCVGDEAEEKASQLKAGEILLLENTRFHKEESKGDEELAKKMAKLGDVYVNDAFGSAHRAHSSTTTVAQFFDEKAAGYLLKAEIDNADKVMESGEKPFTAIMGGAKISDKIEIIERLLDKVNHLIIGGAMSYTFFKAMGGEIGKSLVETDKLDLANELIRKAKDKGVELHLPIDSIITQKIEEGSETRVANNHAIQEEWMGVDIGPEARQVFADTIASSKIILWNGPMGIFEIPDYAEGTKAVAEAVVKATEGGAFSLIGGGDSAAAVISMGYGDKVSYVSTGGGALLEYMEGKELPGVKALG
ncbi:phosphoglycerate kinase [Catalinimonas alkaloidigena]|uniref:phosphoglycerate kinase n=1 Tax=Catalinimonas alkaloidigena TaxID=1075417 RepID=UPI002405F146|nr:phosphoglycerate kinase [Catalinimonas alkaloidigena]MDF9795027.1 phosphoglycerate kinase [Catalinimonas alkaloidigena]